MKKLYAVTLISMLSAASIITNDRMRCGGECLCVTECRCEDVMSKAGSALFINNLSDLLQILANNRRVVVKFYKSACPACSFGQFFNDLVHASTDDTIFVNFRAVEIQAEVLETFGLTKLPTIVEFIDGVKTNVIK